MSALKSDTNAALLVTLLAAALFTAPCAAEQPPAPAGNGQQ